MKEKASRGLTILLVAAIAAAGFLILRTRGLQLSRLLPYAGLLLCPLMHVFMHRGHGAHDAHESEQQDETRGGQGTTAHRQQPKES